MVAERLKLDERDPTMQASTERNFFISLRFNEHERERSDMRT